MSNPNYPPGHPTGSTYSVANTECPNCGERITVHHEYERDTNAHVIDDGYCESCNHELTHDELNNLDWDSGEEEYDWDAAYDAKVEHDYLDSLEKDDPYI